MNRIKNRKEYEKLFPRGKSRKALEYALDIRKFEIELYWKRTNYFWVLIAAAFAGYFVIADKNEEFLSLVISCLGFVISLGWYLVNRGSKYWQENWERHVDSLEDNYIGPLYKTVIDKGSFSFFKFWSGYPYSVSKINQLISLFVTIIWFGLIIKSLPNEYFPWSYKINPTCLLLILTASFSIMLITLGKGWSHKKKRPIDFVETEQ